MKTRLLSIFLIGISLAGCTSVAPKSLNTTTTAPTQDTAAAKAKLCADFDLIEVDVRAGNSLLASDIAQLTSDYVSVRSLVPEVTSGMFIDLKIYGDALDSMNGDESQIDPATQERAAIAIVDWQDYCRS